MIRFASLRPPCFTLLLVAAISLPGVAAWYGVQKLSNERNRLATIEAMAEAGARPRVPLIAERMGFSEIERHAAGIRFANLLTATANGHRLLIERIAVTPDHQDKQALLIADISLSGSEVDIRRFVSLIESGEPAIRFESWRIARTAHGEATVRIQARALALWIPDK
jgi:hypothetical protein